MLQKRSQIYANDFHLLSLYQLCPVVIIQSLWYYVITDDTVTCPTFISKVIQMFHPLPRFWSKTLGSLNRALAACAVLSRFLEEAVEHPVGHSKFCYTECPPRQTSLAAGWPSVQSLSSSWISQSSKTSLPVTWKNVISIFNPNFESLEKCMMTAWPASRITLASNAENIEQSLKIPAKVQPGRPNASC